MFYTFIQNNSYGRFEGHRFVIIEAENAEEANGVAETKGIYFYGVYDGIDCHCCGHRWNVIDNSDGNDTPLIFGAAPENGGYKPWIIYYKDGSVKEND